jgi:DNA-binding LytR/AlgR family response regulator
LTEDKLLVKLRLYQLEERLDKCFIKINQSCIANVRQISKVEATFSGALSVVFKNGYRDYISRRNLKKVKERLGVKL